MYSRGSAPRSAVRAPGSMAGGRASGVSRMLSSSQRRMGTAAPRCRPAESIVQCKGKSSDIVSPKMVCKKRKGGGWWLGKKDPKAEHDGCTGRSARGALLGSVDRCLHIIISACMIQVFKLICFGENKVENVQRRAVPTGGPGCRRRARLCAPALRVLRSRRESTSTRHMDSPPPPRWSTERKALMGEGSLLLGGPHRLAE